MNLTGGGGDAHHLSPVGIPYLPECRMDFPGSAATGSALVRPPSGTMKPTIHVHDIAKIAFTPIETFPANEKRAAPFSCRDVVLTDTQGDSWKVSLFADDASALALAKTNLNRAEPDAPMDETLVPAGRLRQIVAHGGLPASHAEVLFMAGEILRLRDAAAASDPRS